MNLSQLAGMSVFALFCALIWRHLEISKAARIYAANHCAQQNLTLLDQSVILAGMKIVRSHRSLFSIERRYRFEFSTIGDARYQGELIFNGQSLKTVELDAFKI